MAKTRAQKEAMTAGVADRLQRMSSAVFADFRGLKMQELEELRKSARASDCEYLVVKKTLLRAAAGAQGIPADVAEAPGGLSVLFGFSDPVAPARIVKTFAKAHAALKVLGGLIREEAGIRSLATTAVAALGDLPSREQLVARAVGSIAAPLRGLVGVMQGNLRKLIYALNAVQQSQAK